MHDGVALRDKLAEKPGVADVAHDELDPVRGQPGDVFPPPRVGQLVQHGHMHAGIVLHHVPHEVRPDELAAACNEDAFGIEGAVVSPFHYAQNNTSLLTQSPNRSQTLGPAIKRERIRYTLLRMRIIRRKKPLLAKLLLIRRT